MVMLPPLLIIIKPLHLALINFNLEQQIKGILSPSYQLIVLFWTFYLEPHKKLSQLSESFSGAEIKQSIIEAMYHAFYEQREFTTDDICLALNELIPLAQLESKQTLKLQSWASSGKIRLASTSSLYI